MSEAPKRGREILFEFVQLGPQVRVAAIDAASGTEAVIIGPVQAARADLEKLALAKLRRLLDQSKEDDGDDDPPAPSGRGKLV